MSKILSKKIYRLLCVLLCAGRMAYGQSVPVGTAPTYSRNCFVEYFTSISASGTNVISNTISVTGGTCSGTWFNNYGSQGLVVVPGSQVSISFTRYTNTYSGYVSVYVDWNNDNVYSASELVGPAVRLSPTTLSGVQTFTVPSCVSPAGNAHMRVMLTEIGDAVGTPASGNYGQAYDFYIRVTCPVLPSAQTVCMGTPKDLLPGASCGSWTSSNPAVATVSSSGTVTGVAVGTAIMSYAPTFCTAAYCTVTVQPPVSIAGSSTVCTGFTTALTGTPSGGTWTTSNAAVATVSSSGVVSGVTSGSATITYTATTGCAVTKAMNVIPSLTPITGPSFLCPGTSIVLANSTPGGTWSSTNPAVATVSASGGVVTAPGSYDGSGPGGTVTIKYTTGFCGVISRDISVKPANIIGPTSVCVGTSVTLNGVEPGGTWSFAPSSSGGGVALSPSGVVTGLHMSGGDGIVYTSPSGCVVTRGMFADGAIITTAAVCVGSTITPTLVSWVPPGGGPGSVILIPPTIGTWSSSNPSIASVDASSGDITGVSHGTCTITMTTPGGCVSTKVISVNDQPVAANTNLCTGSTVGLPDDGYPGTWTGSNAFATVDAGGTVAGVAVGSAIITFTSGTYTGCKLIYPITVNKSPTISGPGIVCVGSSIFLSATPAGGTWSTSTPYASVGTTGGSGFVTGISVGLASIVYITSNGCANAMPVSVHGPATISGPSSSVCTAMTLTASEGGGSWSSSNPIIVPVSTSGVVSGGGYGTATITYTTGFGCVSTYNVSSSSPTITGPDRICSFPASTAGNSYTAVPSGGTWSSSNTDIFNVYASSGGASTQGNQVGTATLYYSYDGCASHKDITVDLNPSTVIFGGEGYYSTTLHMLYPGYPTVFWGHPNGGTWQSSNPSVAGITGGGVVTSYPYYDKGTVNLVAPGGPVNFFYVITYPGHTCKAYAGFPNYFVVSGAP